jgi:hypothetical protein
MSYDPQNPYASPLQGSGSAGGAPDPYAVGKVQGPAIGLIVTAILGMVGSIAGVVMNLAGMGAAGAQMPPNAPPEMAKFINTMNQMSAPLGIASSFIGLGIAVVILLGALKLKNLQSYGFAMTSAILALLPCVSPCCLVGLPVGIWAIVVMNDNAVKSAFR